MIDLTTLAAAKAYTDRQRLAYDESVSLGDTLTWDGTPTDVYVDDGNYGVYAKVSGNTPTKEDLLDGRLTTKWSDNTWQYTELDNDAFNDEYDNVLVVARDSYKGHAVVVYADNATMDGITFPEKGIYFLHWNRTNIGFVESLQTLAYTFTKGELKKLDKKYLPDNIGVKSWNDLTDKPFSDESVTIEWDGDSTGKVSAGEGMATKVSDLTPEPSDLVGGTFTFTNGSQSETMTITEDMIQDNRGGGVPVVMIGYVLIAYAPYSDAGVPEAGIYFVTDEDTYASSLTYGSIKKLDPKYLPEGGVGYEGVTDIGDTLTWDGTPTDTVVEAMGVLFSKVSDNTPSSDEVIGSHVTVSNGGEYIETEIVSSHIGVFNETVYGIGNVIIVASVDGASCELGGETIVFPKKGIYFSYGDSASTVTYITKLTIPNYNFTKTEVHKIDKKYLPDDIGGKCDLPEITDSDNGKFLQVVDGAYALVALTDVSVEGA